MSRKPSLRTVFPLKLVRSPFNIERTSETVSRTRASGFSNGTPFQRSTIVSLEQPSPRMKRPGMSCASAPDIAANTAGVRVYAGDTAMPIRIVEIVRDSAPASTNGSGPEVSASHALS